MVDNWTFRSVHCLGRRSEYTNWNNELSTASSFLNQDLHMVLLQTSPLIECCKNLPLFLYLQILYYIWLHNLKWIVFDFQLSSFALNTMPEVWPDAVKGIIDTFQQTDIPQLDVRNNLSCLNPYLYSNNVFIKLLPNVKKKRNTYLPKVRLNWNCPEFWDNKSFLVPHIFY